MRKIKAYTVNIVWDDGKEESVYPSSKVKEELFDYFDELEEEEEYCNPTTEEKEA
jgi:hypothetical protein